MEINSHTNLYCIFGKPVRHSLSPIIHNSLFRELNLNSVYLAFEPDSIKSGIESMKTLNILGASVTIPFKVDVMKYIDEIDDLALNIGSANTLINIDGIIKGYNTDGYGALKALEDHKINVKESKILIIGNGGSARAIAFTLLANGADIIIAGRNIDKINSLYASLSTNYKKVDYILLNKIDNKCMEDVDVIINSTPIGMKPDIDSCPIDEELIMDKHSVFDIVYSPENTKLLNIASVKKCKTIKGIEMLINQGVKQFEIWTGKSAPPDVIYKSINEVLYKK